MKVLLLLLVAALLVDAAPSFKGLRPKPRLPVRKGPAAVGALLQDGPRLRITGGDYATFGRFKWQAFITMDGTYYCGGSLISSTFVLTAAQCVAGYAQFLVAVGDTERNTHYSPWFAYSFTYKSIIHEDYQEDTNSNDIGLIEMLAPFEINEYVMPIPLPSPADVSNSYVGQTAVISGFGQTDYESYAEELKYVSQLVMDTKRCERFFGTFQVGDVPVVNETMHICGDGAGAIGACAGDTGGPLTIEKDDGTHQQIGISSFESELGCKLGYPSVYTRITSYVDWINSNAKLTPTP